MNWQVFLYFGTFSFLGGLVALATNARLVMHVHHVTGLKLTASKAVAALLGGIVGGLLAASLEYVNVLLLLIQRGLGQ